ncbi:MAG: hypothetical protein AB8G22_00230 [Saprospiraceae bacterium]
MKAFCTTLLLLILYTSTIYSQKIFQKGALTLRSGEALTGYLFVDNIDRGDKAVIYKPFKDGATQVYLPSEINSFQVNNRRYVVRNVQETQKNGSQTRVISSEAYLEQLEGGKLNLYQHTGVTDIWLYVETSNQKLIKLILQRYYPDPNDRTIILQRDTMGTTKYREEGKYNLNKIYIRQLQQLTRGCSAVQINPKKLALKAAEIRRVIRAYNKCHGEQFLPTVYERKKLELYGIGGYTALPLFSDSDTLMNAFEFGGEIFLPAVTNRISFAFHYHKGDGFERRINFLTNEPYYNPIEFQRSVFRLNYYPLQGRRVQPYASIGLSNRDYRVFFRGRQIGRYDENALFLAVGGQLQIHSRVKALVEVGYPYFPVVKAGIGIRIL